MDYYLLGRLPHVESTKEDKNMPQSTSGNASPNIKTPSVVMQEELHD
jgi:hypothetical protein